MSWLRSRSDHATEIVMTLSYLNSYMYCVMICCMDTGSSMCGDMLYGHLKLISHLCAGCSCMDTYMLISYICVLLISVCCSCDMNG